MVLEMPQTSYTGWPESRFFNILQSYEKFPNYANIFAIIFANNCKNFSSSIFPLTSYSIQLTLRRIAEKFRKPSGYF